MVKNNLLLYWKPPKSWVLSINKDYEVVARGIENGIVKEITFSSDMPLDVIETVLRALGFKKKRRVVV